MYPDPNNRRKCIKCETIDRCITCSPTERKCTECYAPYIPNAEGKCVLCENDEYYKVNLDHYKLDLLTGKNKMINLDYYLYSEGGTIYNDKKGNPSYSLASLAFIGEDKTTKEYGEYLLDENGKVLANATGFYPDCFIKLDNGNYYNTSTDILYDSKLNVIANLYTLF